MQGELNLTNNDLTHKRTQKDGDSREKNMARRRHVRLFRLHGKRLLA